MKEEIIIAICAGGAGLIIGIILCIRWLVKHSIK